jgi:hypothetical protein
MGPFNIIGSNICEQFWALTKLTANVSAAIVGLFNVIGSVFSAQFWVYAKPSTGFFGSNCGPIRYYR